MKRALLLNADYTPLHFMSDTDAIILLYKGRAEVVIDFETGLPSVWEDDAFTTSEASWPNPATLRLKRHVNKRWRPPRFRRRVLFNRDDWRCQYCGTRVRSDTVEIEHVLPRSRGGDTSWTNCVTSCHSCNKRKDDRTPDEAGMPLLKKPANPSSLHFWDATRSDCWHPTWDVWLRRDQT